MTLSKLDVVLVAIAATGLVWIEHNHRVVIGPLAAAEVQRRPSATRALTTTERLPLSDTASRQSARLAAAAV